MNKNIKKTTNFVMMLVGIIASVAIGGLFINGTFLNTVILSWLPLLVHQIVGWILVVSAIGVPLLKLVK